ncbi:ArnT family glycosyltransferase [Belliella buryatensis]|nr:glycosyltransferase family 39 protein [Belliella buryatensis]
MKDIYFYRKLSLSLISIVGLLKLLYFHFSSLSLFTEETQYWLWSKHLDWNYYSKPLMIAVYNYLSTGIFGDTEFAIKFNAILFSSLTAWVIFEFTHLIFQKGKIALYATLILIVMPFFHLGSIFHTTDSSLYFFWILALYLIWKAWVSNHLQWWVWAGIATVFGILSKNIMVLTLPILGIYILLVEPKRFFSKGPWIYVLVSCFSLTPIIVWNIQNDWVTFKHVGTLGGVEGKKSGFDTYQSLKYIGEYIGGQLGFLSPFFIPILILSFRKLNFLKNPKNLFLLLPTLIVWGLFLAMSIFKNVNVNWPAFAMLTLPLLMAKVVYEASSRWKKYTLFSGLITGALLLVLFFPAPFDAIGFKKVLKPSKDPMMRLAGYREMGTRLDHLIDSLKLDRQFIFSDNYHVASEMAFYMQGNPQTYTINLGRRKNQFDLWPGIQQFEEKNYTGIYITKEDQIQEAVRLGFDSLISTEKFYTIHRGDTVKTYTIAILANLNHIEEVDTGEF